MWSKRQGVDYALQRRNKLQALRRPRRSRDDAVTCDADPLLIGSATHRGELSPRPRPNCDASGPANLNYVFGNQIGQYSGRFRSSQELTEMLNQYGESRVRVVEVCTQRGWNHMISTYLLGDGIRRRPPRRQQTVEDIYG